MGKSVRHKKTPTLAGDGVLGNEINFEEEIVMANNSTAVSNVIPFRDSKLLLVEKDGQPFVPMKPVVEGMGLAWQTQHRKLMDGRFAAVITIMVTTGFDGKQYEMACLPLRKLPGWLMSIHASKVREELRDGVIAYQNECDDMLWNHWSRRELAANREVGSGLTLIGQTIGTDGFHMLGSLVKGKVSGLPVAARRSASAKLWAQTHAAFGVRCAEDIPAEQLNAARNFVAAYAVNEGSFLPKSDGLPAQGGVDTRYMVSWNHRGERQITEIPSNAYVLSQYELMKGMVSAPGDIMVSTENMFEFLMSAVVNLKCRHDNMVRRGSK